MYNKNYYPTPLVLLEKMSQKVSFKNVGTILEPSAGSGTALKFLTKKLKSCGHPVSIDAIELDPALRSIIKAEGYRVVHDDFLTFKTQKKYDLVFANPPFDSGATHLLRMLEMQEAGGQIVCLLNAETLKNPFSKKRKELMTKLTECDAEVTFIPDAFKTAERQTGVEVALVYLNIPKQVKKSLILDTLERKVLKEQEYNGQTKITSRGVEGMVARYNFEIRAGLQLIDEYTLMQPYLLDNVKGDTAYSSPILKLSLVESNGYTLCGDGEELRKSFIQHIRAKYWRALLTSKKFSDLMTTSLSQQYMNDISLLSDYDFSLFNITEVKRDIVSKFTQNIEEEILQQFDQLSHKHSYLDTTSKNIYLYNGWKTNKAYKIAKKVILPLDAWDSIFYRMDITKRRVVEVLSDLEKTFNYLAGEPVEVTCTVERNLREANKLNITKGIVAKYFTITFYKKGTCHITFTDERLLKKFNILGSQKKGWLPPVYTKKPFQDMTNAEKEVVKSFEGEESYRETYESREYYTFNMHNLLITAGE